MVRQTEWRTQPLAIAAPFTTFPAPDHDTGAVPSAANARPAQAGNDQHEVSASVW